MEKKHFAQVAAEMAADNTDAGLMTQAFALSDGDPDKTKAAYIRLRAAEIAEQEGLATPTASTQETSPAVASESILKQKWLLTGWFAALVLILTYGVNAPIQSIPQLLGASFVSLLFLGAVLAVAYGLFIACTSQDRRPFKWHIALAWLTPVVALMVYSKHYADSRLATYQNANNSGLVAAAEPAAQAIQPAQPAQSEQAAQPVQSAVAAPDLNPAAVSDALGNAISAARAKDKRFSDPKVVEATSAWEKWYLLYNSPEESARLAVTSVSGYLREDKALCKPDHEIEIKGKHLMTTACRPYRR